MHHDGTHKKELLHSFIRTHNSKNMEHETHNATHALVKTMHSQKEPQYNKCKYVRSARQGGPIASYARRVVA